MFGSLPNRYPYKMMAKLLTAAAVAKLRPSKSRREIPDGGCPGLYLVVQPSGSKSWALRYRRPDNRTAKLVLGSVYAVKDKETDAEPVIGGHLTVAGAHRLVADLRHRIAQGLDPGAKHLAERRVQQTVENRGNAFGLAARDFIEEYASKKIRRWKEQSRLLGIHPNDFEIISHSLAARWRARPIGEIDSNDIYAVIDETRRSGAPGLERRSVGLTETRARSMLSCLSRMFDWLKQQRRIDRNPCAGVHRPDAPKSRERVLSDTEIVRFWSAAQAERKEFGDILRLLLLTGCRLNEVTGMALGELNENLTSWTIPGSRTKNKRPHVVPLPLMAQTILRDALGARIKQELVFSTNGKSQISGWSKIKSRLDEVMNIPAWRLHDLRRTAATGMAEIGVAPHIVEAVLNHISGTRAGVAGTYNRAAYALEKREALQRWNSHISQIVDYANET